MDTGGEGEGGTNWEMRIDVYTLCCAVLSRFFATPWTVDHQTPLSMGILQARTLEWVHRYTIMCKIDR